MVDIVEIGEPVKLVEMVEMDDIVGDGEMVEMVEIAEIDEMARWFKEF
jgi:hypothetical protein